MSDFADKYAGVQELTDEQFREAFDIRILVAGSRGIRDYDYFCQALSCINLELVRATGCFISGKASKGPDAMIIRWCKENEILCREYPADWDGLGKRAGYVRNTQMGDVATEAYVFWDCVSPGTKHMIDYLGKSQVAYDLFLLDSEETDPSTLKQALMARTYHLDPVSGALEAIDNGWQP